MAVELRGDGIAEETLVAVVAEVVDAVVVDPTIEAEVVFAVVEAEERELVIPYWRRRAANVSAVTLDDTVGVMGVVAAMEGFDVVVAGVAPPLVLEAARPL